jgi:hypothetical protein
MALRLGADALASHDFAKSPVSGIEPDHKRKRQTDEHEQGTAGLISTLSAEDCVTNNSSQPDQGECREDDATAKGEPECLAQPLPVVVEHQQRLYLGS